MVKVKSLFVALILTIVISGGVLAQENASKTDETLETQHKTDTHPIDESNLSANSEVTVSEPSNSGQGGGGATYTVWRGSEPY